MPDLLHLVTDPASWAALLTLILLEVVLGVDNLIFIAILSNKLPEAHRARTRTIGLVLALGMRLLLLSTIAWIVGLTRPVFDLGYAGAPVHGQPSFETAFSWRDIILIAGGVFLLWKAGREIHESVAPEPGRDKTAELARKGPRQLGFASAIVQIILIDMVFSFDSILTAVGMTDQLPIMMAAVVVAVVLMMVASGPLAGFVERNPTIVMLALAFLIMIGMTLIAEGFGFHVPKGYIYVAMAFSVAVELLNMAARRKAGHDEPAAEAVDVGVGGARRERRDADVVPS